jgi:hypothetical protein
VEAEELRQERPNFALVEGTTALGMDIARVGEMLRRTRDMLDQVEQPEEAVLLVRRTTAAEKVVQEALKTYRAQEQEQFELKQELAETHLRTQRRAGELLLKAKKHRGGRPPTTLSSARAVEGEEKPVTLRELGISAQESHRWQRIAIIPTDHFEAWVADSRADGRELATARLLALAARYAKPEQAAERETVQRPEARTRERTAYEQARAVISRMASLDPSAVASAIPVARRAAEREAVRELQRWLADFEQALRPGPAARSGQPAV